MSALRSVKEASVMGVEKLETELIRQKMLINAKTFPDYITKLVQNKGCKLNVIEERLSSMTFNLQVTGIRWR